MTPESLAARIRSMLADNPTLILYAKDDKLYAGYLMADRDDADVFVTDVEL